MNSIARSALLHDVRQFVREQFSAACRRWVVIALAEINVAAERKGFGLNRSIKVIRLLIGVDADAAKVRLEGLLHRATDRSGQGCAAAA